MSEILPALAFGLLIAAHILAVAAAHRRGDAGQAERKPAAEAPDFADHRLFLTAESLHGPRRLEIS